MELSTPKSRYKGEEPTGVAMIISTFRMISRSVAPSPGTVLEADLNVCNFHLRFLPS